MLLQGAGCLRKFRAFNLRSPQGLSDLTIKIPKGIASFPTASLASRVSNMNNFLARILLVQL